MLLKNTVGEEGSKGNPDWRILSLMNPSITDNGRLILPASVLSRVEAQFEIFYRWKYLLYAVSDQQYIEQILREISYIIRALMRLLPASSHGVSVNFIHWWKIYLFSPVSSFFFHLLISRTSLVRQSCLHDDKIKGGMFACRLFLCINSIAMFADVLPSSC